MSCIQQPSVFPLYQVPESLLHPKRLIGTIHMLQLGRARRNIGLGVPGALALLKLAVEVGQDGAEGQTSDDSQAEHGRDDAVALAVPVLLQVPHVAARHVAQLRERVDEGDGHGALRRRPRERRADPRVEDDEAGVGAGLEEERDVARRYVEGRHADDETDDAANDGADDVPELPMGLV